MPHIFDCEIDRTFYGWVMSAESAVELTLVRAGEPGRHHVIEKIDASYSDVMVSGLLVVKFGDAVAGRKYIHGAGALDFPGYGRHGQYAGEPISIVLATGTDGAIGTLTVSGYTTGA